MTMPLNLPLSSVAAPIRFGPANYRDSIGSLRLLITRHCMVTLGAAGVVTLVASAYLSHELASRPTVPILLVIEMFFGLPALAFAVGGGVWCWLKAVDREEELELKIEVSEMMEALLIATAPKIKISETMTVAIRSLEPGPDESPTDFVDDDQLCDRLILLNAWQQGR